MNIDKVLQSCSICPRHCKINRITSKGFCKASNKIKLSKVSLHMWEEPCISGKNGSGTIFFSNCNLNCVFCQNYKISQEGYGKEISIERLSDIFLEQQARGANNINLVTPTQYALQIIEAIKISKEKGLTLPILYNSNGYESVETIKLLKDYIDVYLPDLKYYNDKYALKYSNADNYFSIASAAINEMFKNAGPIEFDENGLIKKGLIIRHLMLPHLLFDSKKIIDYIYKTYKDDVYISLMNQYTPMYHANRYKELSHPLKPQMYDTLINYCVELGIKNAFIQESGTNSKEFVPDFDLSWV